MPLRAIVGSDLCHELLVSCLHSLKTKFRVFAFLARGRDDRNVQVDEGDAPRLIGIGISCTRRRAERLEIKYVLN